MKLFLVALLVTVLLFLIVKIMKKKAEEASPDASPVDPTNLRITDARPGDTISMKSVGRDFEDILFIIDRRDRYRAGRDTWYEVSGQATRGRVSLEVVDDDELELLATLDREQPTLEDLRITEEDLVRMDEERRRSNSILYDDQPWFYTSSGEVDYYKNDRGEGEGFYSWDFRSDDGKKMLSIEKWEGEPFETSVTLRIPPGDVQVFRG